MLEWKASVRCAASFASIICVLLHFNEDIAHMGSFLAYTLWLKWFQLTFSSHWANVMNEMFLCCTY